MTGEVREGGGAEQRVRAVAAGTMAEEKAGRRARARAVREGGGCGGVEGRGENQGG